MIYIILGMHKSGTTLISEMLHKSGINMVDSYDERASYSSGNKMERESMQTLNKEILKAFKTHSLHIPTDQNVRLTNMQTMRMRELIEECCMKYPEWGFKDPRSCITYPLWKNELPPHKLIVVFRHPVQVMNHYKNLVRWGRIKAYFSWASNNELLLRIVYSNNLPILILNYLDLMTDESCIKKLEDFIEKPVNDIRRIKEFNNRSTKSLLFNFLDFVTQKRATTIVTSLEDLKS